MDDQELPTDLSRMSLGPVAPGSAHAQEPQGQPGSPRQEATDRTVPEAEGGRPSLPPSGWPGNEYNAGNGAGGVCAAPPLTSPPDIGSLANRAPASLIPDQPLPPGAPQSLAAAAGGQVQAVPGRSTPSTDLSTAVPQPPKDREAGEPGADHESHSHPESGGLVKPKVQHPGQNPFKPVTPEQIAAFANQWHDPDLTLDIMARRYKTNPRTIQKWRAEFGLPTRPEALKAQAEADRLLGPAQAMIRGVRDAAAMTIAQGQDRAQTPQVLGPEQFNPLADAEIAQALAEIRAEARMITAHSDLRELQRRLMRLSIMIAAKVPIRNWDGLQATIEGLARSLLQAQRIEAEIPSSGADPVLLRKEAAAQMMKELKSVLTPDEQRLLADLVKRGADRLMNRGERDTVVAEGAA